MSLVSEVPAPRKAGVHPKLFKEAMAAIPSAVTIVTTWNADRTPAGATLSAVVPLSLDPSLMLACFDNRSETLRAIRAEQRFLIHVLSDGQQDLALSFARRCDNKFEGVRWRKGVMQLPQLPGCAVVIGCRLAHISPGGDHALVTGEITHLKSSKESCPLVYVQRQLIPLEIEGAE